MLHPPCTSSALMIRMAALLSVWYSSSRRVRMGATTTLSPVWTPIGSTFSMPQTMMQVSPESRITSNSISFHPATLSSTSTWWILERESPISMIRRISSGVCATPPPEPPRVYAGLMIAGRPTSQIASSICFVFPRIILRGTGSPMAFIRSRNCSRSSPR